MDRAEHLLHLTPRRVFGDTLISGLLVIPAQAGIQTAILDSRLRGNDETWIFLMSQHARHPENKVAVKQMVPVRGTTQSPDTKTMWQSMHTLVDMMQP